MASEFHKSASKNGVSITAYRGDGSALLAFDLDPQLATELFAGFAIEATAPDGTKEWLMNRLNFDIGLHSASTPEERQKNWTPSNAAPQASAMPDRKICRMGWLMGLEPTTTGITIRDSTS